MKCCTKCNRHLPLSSFYEASSGGHQSRCITCHIRAAADWKRRNRDKVNANQNATRRLKRERGIA